MSNCKISSYIIKMPKTVNKLIFEFLTMYISQLNVRL